MCNTYMLVLCKLRKNKKPFFAKATKDILRRRNKKSFIANRRLATKDGLPFEALAKNGGAGGHPLFCSPSGKALQARPSNGVPAKVHFCGV